MKKYRKRAALFFLVVIIQPVFAVVSVSVIPTGGFTILPGVLNSRQLVATATIDADTATPNYQIELNDDNNGVLLNGANTIPYGVSYDNQTEITLSTTPTVVESATTPVVAASRTIAVTLSAADTIGKPAGNYTANITITISAF